MSPEKLSCLQTLRAFTLSSGRSSWSQLECNEVISGWRSPGCWHWSCSPSQCFGFFFACVAECQSGPSLCPAHSHRCPVFLGILLVCCLHDYIQKVSGEKDNLTAGRQCFFFYCCFLKLRLHLIQKFEHWNDNWSPFQEASSVKSLRGEVTRTRDRQLTPAWLQEREGNLSWGSVTMATETVNPTWLGASYLQFPSASSLF